MFWTERYDFIVNLLKPLGLLDEGMDFSIHKDVLNELYIGHLYKDGYHFDFKTEVPNGVGARELAQIFKAKLEEYVPMFRAQHEEIVKRLEDRKTNV